MDIALHPRRHSLRPAWLAPLAGALLAAGIAVAPAAGAQEMAPMGPTTPMAAPVAVSEAGALGPTLTDGAGRTLYRFTRDAAGESTCYNACAVAWPPLLVDAAPMAPAGLPGALTAVARTDGTLQAVYNGQPLYYYGGDAQPGDANGQGVGGVWFIAAPDAGPLMAGA
jgi:predicted lipoprotein with Yx(FWY)xxD motif